MRRVVAEVGYTITKILGTEQCGKLAHEFKVTALRIVVWIDHDLLDQTANRRDHFELLLG
jgi:hypothetical protein